MNTQNTSTRISFQTFAAFVIGSLLPSCGDSNPGDRAAGSGEKVVFTSVPPVAGLVKRIAGDRLQVESLVDETDDPHGFSPTPKQLVSLGDSAAFFVVGMPFEKQLVSKLSEGAERVKVIDVATGIEKLEFDHHDHDHGDDHAHDHGGEEEAETDSSHDHHDHGEGGDPHVWLSPALLKKQAMAIESALYEIDPDGHDAYHANLESLLAELDGLDAELKEALAPWKGKSFYVYHEAFGYFADAYGLEQKAIEVGGRSPEPKRVFELIEQAKADGVGLIVVQPQFDTNSAQAIAEGIGGAVVSVNPIGEDVFSTLRSLAEKVKQSQPATAAN